MISDASLNPPELLLTQLDLREQRSASLSRTRSTIPGSEFKTILSQLIPASPDAPEMAKLSASFFS
jgi:hypothetical protein